MKRSMKLFKSNIKSTIWRYYAFTFLRDLAFFSAVLVPFFTDWGHITLFQVQILQSWFMLWIFILEVPTGAVADYLGRKHSLAIGGVMVALAALVYGSIPDFKVFLFAEFLFAMAAALMSGADNALLYDALVEAGKEDESKRIFGRAHSIGLLGIFISAPIGSFMAPRLGINAPMLLSAIPFILAATVAWTMKEPKIHRRSSESTRYLDIAKKGFVLFYNHRVLRMIALDGIIVASAAYFVLWLYQPLLKNAGMPIFYFGFAHAFLVAAEMVIAANFVFLEKVFGSGKGLLRFGALATALAFILVAFFPSMLTIALLLIFAGGFGLTRLELMGAYMNRFIPSEQRATVLSSISMFRRFALVPLNPLVGLAADHSLSVALLALGLLPLAVFFFSPVEQEMLEEVAD